jgi:hypothetical protein
MRADRKLHLLAGAAIVVLCIAVFTLRESPLPWSPSYKRGSNGEALFVDSKYFTATAVTMKTLLWNTVSHLQCQLKGKKGQTKC